MPFISNGKAILPTTGNVNNVTAGEDGNLKKGNTTSPRFVQYQGNANLVLDKHTNLVWPKCPAKVVTGFSGNEALNYRGGSYNGSVTYAVNDVVYIPAGPVGLGFVCIQANAPGNAHNTTETAYWTPLLTGHGNGDTDWSTGTAGLPSWNTAITNCTNLNYGGFTTGWRLPNMLELFSIINLDTASFDYYAAGGVNLPTTSLSMLTSTTAHTSTNALTLTSFMGTPQMGYLGKISTGYVIPCRNA